jgi:hypothetical protein
LAPPRQARLLEDGVALLLAHANDEGLIRSGHASSIRWLGKRSVNQAQR